MSGMNPSTGPSPAAYPRYPREIAAAVTLRAAASALVAPGAPEPPGAGAVALVTACGALATRLALIRFIAGASDVDPGEVRPVDSFTEPTPDALHGVGPAPDRDRVRLAGDRCVAAGPRWRDDHSVPDADAEIGVAGALALGAWCSWALGSEAKAAVRARYALDVNPLDPLAGLVLRSTKAGSGPTWAG